MTDTYDTSPPETGYVKTGWFSSDYVPKTGYTLNHSQPMYPMPIHALKTVDGTHPHLARIVHPVLRKAGKVAYWLRESADHWEGLIAHAYHRTGTWTDHEVVDYEKWEREHPGVKVPTHFISQFDTHLGHYPTWSTPPLKRKDESDG